ncbi:mitochondrial carrier [Teratosphaeria nubilosa]|uniref:Mitochondrial thiamine pyrophosphate carrier 1 n=1 Tax=Teratosphaeria nubilosa TaxID=161662 RepID=A0A6G1LF40_9PEZI|nr:mitochondrial carrier [Teratosphaeria nubilosa]
MDGESHEEREDRLQSLWQKLDTKRKGTLDLAALKAGLQKINHPLKDADNLIKQMMHHCDINHDGKITYDEFVSFCVQTEKELWQLFEQIDRDHNGRLDQTELSQAFERAGIAVSNARLERFFSYIDKNHDGQISFAEWRDFLLFLPTHAPGLRAVLSYYNGTVKLTAEGDVNLSDEALSGLGMALELLKQSLFGAIIQLVRPPHSRTGTLPPPTSVGQFEQHENDLDLDTSTTRPTFNPETKTFEQVPSEQSSLDDDPYIPLKPARRKQEHNEPEVKLTDLVPDVGYFLAGAVSGIVSRTSTAPLDRLKVYLIAQTGNGGNAKDALVAAKQGNAVQATKTGASTLWRACQELWAVGGIRSMFAGNGLNILKVMPESAVKFGSYEASKRTVARLEGHHDPKAIAPSSQFVAGGIAGMISQAVVYPLDTLKFRMQCETVPGGEHGTRLILRTAQRMWAKQGIVSFYRGLPMGLVGMFPYAAIDLFTFESLKKALVTRRMKKEGIRHEEDALPGNFTLAIMGGFSGAVGASLVYPVNLLRTRLQSQGTVQHPRTYTGIVDVTRQTIKGEGVRGLFKGLTPNLLKVVPAVSITYVVYENTKKALHLT